MSKPPVVELISPAFTIHGHPVSPYDPEKMAALSRRLHLMVQEHGLPDEVLLSPDLCGMQCPEEDQVLWQIGRPVACAPELPPNAVVFHWVERTI